MLGIVLLVLNVGKFQLPRYVFPLFMIVPFLCGTNLLLCSPNCPNCFGVDLCDSITDGSIQLHWLSKFVLILHPSLTKSVFFGTLNSSQNLVLKSMTRRGEYRVKHYKLTERELFEFVTKENVLTSDEVIQNVVLCPSVTNLQLLFKNIDENITNLMINQKLWLDLQISIEPLLLKFLSPMEGMPVPTYYGACGDIVVKEFKGLPLNDYYDHNWIARAFLSIQLLKMAEMFTFHHESLIFYFTDISSDNIVVDKFGMIYLTDLDHVIIAERKPNYTDNLPEKGHVHVSAVLDPIRLTVIPSAVCKYPISDHNYFAVCRNILMYSEEVNRGLLSNIPATVEQRESLQELLEECSLPRKYNDRITVGKLLRRILNEAISDFIWNENS